MLMPDRCSRCPILDTLQTQKSKAERMWRAEKRRNEYAYCAAGMGMFVGVLGLVVAVVL